MKKSYINNKAKYKVKDKIQAVMTWLSDLVI